MCRLNLLVFLLMFGVFASSAYGELSDDQCDEEVASRSLPLLEGTRVNSERLHDLSQSARDGDLNAQSEIISALYVAVPPMVRALFPRNWSDDALDEVTQKVLLRVVERNYEYNRFAGNNGATVTFGTWITWYLRAVIRPCTWERRVTREADISAPGDDKAVSFIDSLGDEDQEVSQHEITEIRRLQLEKTVLPFLCEQDAYLLQTYILSGVSVNEISRRKRRSTTTIYLHLKQMRTAVANLLSLWEKQPLPNLQLALQHFEGASAQRDTFVRYTFDHRSFQDIAMMGNTPTHDANKERFKYLRAVSHLADWTARERPQQLKDFWIEILSLRTLHREVTERLVQYWVSQSVYPDSNSTQGLFDDLGLSANRIFGKNEANPNLGPEVVRVFSGDEHALWAFGREVQRRLEIYYQGGVPILSPEVIRLKAFDPYEMDRPRANPVYHSFYLELMEKFRANSQEKVVEVALQFAIENGHLPDPREDLVPRLAIGVKSLFGEGSQFDADGIYAGTACFQGTVEYSRLLHAKRLLEIQRLSRLTRPTVQEEVQLQTLRQLGLQTISQHTQLFSVIPPDFSTRFPLVAAYWPKLQVELQNYGYQRFILEKTMSEIQVDTSQGMEKLLDLESRFFRELFDLASAEEMASLTEETIRLGGVLVEVRDLLLDAFEKDGLIREREEVRALVASEINRRYQVSRGDLLVSRVFFDSDHRIYVLVKGAQQRLYPLTRQNVVLTREAKVRRDRLQSLTAHRYSRPTSALKKCESLYLEAMSSTRVYECRRLARMALRQYLTTKETPTFENLSSWLDTTSRYLFSPGTGLVYFTSRGDFYQQLCKEAEQMAGDPLEQLSDEEQSRLVFLPTTLRSLSGREVENLPQTTQNEWDLNFSYWVARLTSMTRLQLEIFQLHHRDGRNFSEIATGLGTTEAEVLTHYFKAVGNVFLKSAKSIEVAAEYITEVQKLPPYQGLIGAMVSHFRQTGKMPTETTVTDFLPPEFSWISVEQLLGLGSFANQDSGPTGRVFVGFPHLAWAFSQEAVTQRSKLENQADIHLARFTPFQVPWILPPRPGTTGAFLIQQFSETERERERARIIGIAGDLAAKSKKTPSLDEVAEAAGISADEIAGRKNFRVIANHGYRRIFDNIDEYKVATQPTQ